jgi:hypothetical protein
MQTRFGYPIEVWEAIKQETREILIECAKNRQSITYGELSNRIKTARVPHYGFKIAGLLDEISADEFAGDKAPLATLVVRQSDGLPGGGYFKKSLPDDALFDDLKAYWQSEFERTCDDWKDYSFD